MENVQEECGCCEIQDYAEPEDGTTACENCGHSPEEHGPEPEDWSTPAFSPPSFGESAFYLVGSAEAAMPR